MRGKKKYVFIPVGMDLYSPHEWLPPSGTVVVKTSVPGMPGSRAPGLFAFVMDPITKTQYGLVLKASLQPYIKPKKGKY